MKLLAEINALTGAGYSVGFKPLPYSQGVEIKVGIGGCISSWQLTANAMSGVTEEIVADILEACGRHRYYTNRNCLYSIKSRGEQT